MTAAAVGLSSTGIPAGDGSGGASQFDIWSAIQSQKAAAAAVSTPLYIHPLVRRSSSSLSQMSLDVCTESLGSETGSDDLFDELHDREEDPREVKGKEADDKRATNKEVAEVNYPGGGNGRKAPRRRSFPPPLPSICRRDGPCFAMKRHRKDGRLVVEAVLVPSINYLHADRHGGRLLLSFVTTTATTRQAGGHRQQDLHQLPQKLDELVGYQRDMAGGIKDENRFDADEEDKAMEAAEEEEEVEVVDRGTVVEVKVSTQPQQQRGAGAKVLRSSIVINKFVGGSPLFPADDAAENVGQLVRAAAATSPPRRLPSTAAAAAVVASSLSAGRPPEQGGSGSAPAESKLLFASRSRSKAELLHNMRRCSELRRPLFFWEPCCIATSS